MIKHGDSITNTRTGQRMTFLKTWAETNGTQLQIDCYSPPTDAREPEHLHPYQENRFHLLEGELVFSIDGKEQLAKAGDTISIPKNTAHHFWNPGQTVAHYIQEFYPALKIDGFFDTFFTLAREGKLNKKGRPNLFLAAQIMLFYQKEIRLSKPSWLVQQIAFGILSSFSYLAGNRIRYK